MNVADSEVVRAVMGGAGYQWTETTEAADVVFLNTCAIRGIGIHTIDLSPFD
jgi:tRNA-2-methylthio-N6-dimethylallyladenosine synthase